MVPVLCLLFVLSGAAGLMYESIWARYLGLFVGHMAYAQIIVLVIFLGGMSAGALVVSRRSERLKQPLWAYAAIEFAIGYLGLFFHDMFQAVTGWAYASVYPELAGSWILTAAKWTVAAALILPQSVLLGMTFPLMSAGILRLTRGQPGRILSLLYFSNSLGAAVGVLVAGFYLVERVGLPGTLIAAAVLNLGVSAATAGVLLARRKQTRRPSTTLSEPAPSRRAATGLERLLILVSVGTAVGSFIYEIAWTRMLALVLGSATHSFELMLSAFILGLALGAWWIRPRADRLAEPLRTLGLVQCTMGMLALATLPLYLASFDWIGSLLQTFTRTDSGYVGFTIARYGLCLIVMLPATFCAGMTLPLITRMLIANGSGERAVGAVYSWNTLGSIIGVVLGGLVLLPWMGLKGMLVAGALVDIGLGLFLLFRVGAKKQHRRLLIAAAAASLAFTAVIAGGVRLDTRLLSSGVYRTGTVIGPEAREVTFYRDGRTATVTASRLMPSGQISLATNGKPDASLAPFWYRTCSSTAARVPLTADAGTQTLLPLITLAYAPGAKTAAIIGQGSGMSSHLLLGSPAMRDLVTIEIEPQMIEGSRAFYPANRRAFDDPRSHIVIDDAKSYFASQQRKFDLIISEPSNPWVSGVSGLFTTEFYDRIRQYLTPEGVFGQWLHLYELDDDLVLSVLAALHQNFRSYEVYQVARGDILVVASNLQRLPAPDWRVFQSPALQADLCRFVSLNPEVLDGLHLAGKRELGPLLQPYQPANSDYFPVLDLGAERRRFRHDFAGGFPALSVEWYNLVASQRGRRIAATQEVTLGLPESPRVWARAVGGLLRQPASAQTDTAFGPMSRDAMFRWRQWQGAIRAERAPAGWGLWLDQAAAMERLISGGTAGIADEEFYAGLRRTMTHHGAPAPVRDVVAFRHAMATWKFTEASEVGERLVPLIVAGERWMPPDELRDDLVMARLHIKDVLGARRAYDVLTPLSIRPRAELRSQLLTSYLRMAEWMRASLVRQPTKAISTIP
jgi:predicted membrane-bound spermidine synthase